MSQTYTVYTYERTTLRRWFWVRVKNLGLNLNCFSYRVSLLWTKADDLTTAAFSHCYARGGWGWKCLQSVTLHAYMLAQKIDALSIWLDNVGGHLFQIGYVRSGDDVLDALNMREDEFPSEYMNPRQIAARWQQRIAEYADAPLLLLNQTDASRSAQPTQRLN